jgi:hypothetical protein
MAIKWRSASPNENKNTIFRKGNHRGEESKKEY